MLLFVECRCDKCGVPQGGVREHITFYSVVFTRSRSFPAFTHSCLFIYHLINKGKLIQISVHYLNIFVFLTTKMFDSLRRYVGKN